MSHQSETILENNLIKQLIGLGYPSFKIRTVAVSLCENENTAIVLNKFKK